MHISNKIWELKHPNKERQAIIQKLSEKFNISPIIATIITNRGFEDFDEVERFLNPNLKDFFDPFLMKDMNKAVERIMRAISNKEKIIVFGDYDVDGITSTSILLKYLKELAVDVDFYIPDRMEEGYGLSNSSIDKLALMGTKLIITVDCGITAVEEIEYIKSKGMDIIITDHHECKDEIPKAYAVVNPKQRNCMYPFKELAGVGVVFKLLQALGKTMQIEDVIDKYIEIVALGTVADVVPLIGENRIIVKHGLKKIKNTSNFGIRALINIAGIELKDINTTSIGYILAPRINAAGRIGDASRGVELFLSQNSQTASEIAIELDNYNKERQQTENEILNQALEMIEQNKYINNHKIIVLASDNWHHGVIGIVASRITEKYNKPSILISFDDEDGKGSGRSIIGFNIFDALTNCSELVEKFGGHELAVGLSINKNNVDEFRERINQYADKHIDDDSFYPHITIEAKLSRDDFDFMLLDQLKMLEPYGISNPNPVFTYSGLKIVDSKTVGDGKHLKLRLEDEGKYIDSIGFNMGELASKIDLFDKIDVVFSLELNKWNGQERLQMNLKDLRTTSNIIFKEKYYSTLENSILDQYNINEIETEIVNNIDRYSGSIVSILENGNRNLILINTLMGAMDYVDIIKKLDYKYKDLFKLFYNTISNYKATNNIVVINPYLNSIDMSSFDNVFLYDVCFNKGQYQYLTSNSKKIYIIDNTFNYNSNLDVFDDIIPDRDDLIKTYQYIRSRNVNDVFEGDIYSITREIAISYNIDMNSYKIRKIFEVFNETDLIDIEVKNDYYRITLRPQSGQKVNIMNSKGIAELIKIKDEFKYFIDFLKKKKIC